MWRTWYIFILFSLWYAEKRIFFFSCGSFSVPKQSKCVSQEKNLTSEVYFFIFFFSLTRYKNLCRDPPTELKAWSTAMAQPVETTNTSWMPNHFECSLRWTLYDVFKSVAAQSKLLLYVWGPACTQIPSREWCIHVVLVRGSRLAASVRVPAFCIQCLVINSEVLVETTWKMNILGNTAEFCR